MNVELLHCSPVCDGVGWGDLISETPDKSHGTRRLQRVVLRLSSLANTLSVRCLSKTATCY